MNGMAQVNPMDGLDIQIPDGVDLTEMHPRNISHHDQNFTTISKSLKCNLVAVHWSLDVRICNVVRLSGLHSLYVPLE